MLAIAIFGALIAGKFGSTVDGKVSGSSLSPQAESAISEAKDNPLQQPSTTGVPRAQAAEVTSATTAGAEDGFHLAMMAAGTLMVVGGVVAGIGLRNPPREDEYDSPRACPAGEAAHCPDHLEDTPAGRETVAEPA